jgi:hypothetical protein
MASSLIGAASVTVTLRSRSWAIRVGAFAPPMTTISMPSRSVRVFRSIIWFSTRPMMAG